MVDAMQTADYVSLAEKIIADEEDMLSKFFNEESKNAIMAETRKALLVEPIQRLMGHASGLQKMFENDDVKALSCIFRLYKPLDSSLKELSGMCRLRVVERGERIVDLANEEFQVVEDAK